MTFHDHARAFIDLLDAEQAALLCGAYERLEHLTEEKLRLGPCLEQAAMLPEYTNLIAQKIRRNALMLEAASDGFEQTRKVLAAFRSGENSVVYRRDGSRQAVRQADVRLERKT